ncbi:histidine kinase [Aestuariivirga sp.]|uniref:histidine kinase n=1 Tax=Aestuariivirga sp. TaxID=2650926 RepID=UPI0039E21C90
MNNVLTRLDPRRHVAAAIGWSVGLLALLSAIVVSIAVTLTARSDLEGDAASIFAAETARLAEALDVRLDDKLRVISSSAQILDATRTTLAPQQLSQPVLDAAGRSVDGFDWVGIINPAGTVVSGSDRSASGETVAGEAWFARAQAGLSVAVAPLRKGSDPALIIAAPLTGQQPSKPWVLVGRLKLAWLEKTERDVVRALHLTPDIETAVLTAGGAQLAGDWTMAKDAGLATLARLRAQAHTDGTPEESGAVELDRRLVGFARTHGSAMRNADPWWVLMRQPEPDAFSKPLAESWKLFWIVLASGIVTAAGAAAATALLLRRLNGLAENARRILQGSAERISVPQGQDEISAVGASLAATFDSLQESNRTLSALNRELDQRVEERTREVHRLFEESKNAAITRERLQMARNVHDTLAHSMLAVLSQIRLARKVETSKPEMLAGELAEAERVAKDGLDTARSAIGQLRYVAVRDDGLGAAMERLVKTLRERIVAEVSLTIAPELRPLATQTAETLHRIAEEALRNVEKHANPTHVDVDFHLADTGDGRGTSIILTVRDDGTGFDPGADATGHYGLIGLREQASLIGARLTITSAPGSGTTVRADVPAGLRSIS